MLYITRRERFSAAHKLWNLNISEEENNKLFDKCAYPNYHGHNYDLYITVAGEIDKISGYVIDAKILKTIIFDKILSKVDHRNLNVDVEFLKGINPTSENLIVAFWKELKPEINTDTRKLYKIKLYETENNIAEYYGN
ncbi:MAG: 6-pyruvoyl tetrahydrobiopterin synthase [Bacteroidetes bacterium CG2_30_33_31]|nr:MAG: 6-pyruvoyl tetrahydrobiopterin synthase [Bacteroidetes bacterium CG2_30_33_31]